MSTAVPGTLQADLVLEGGGVKGVALAGAVVRLARAGYAFPRVAGSSAGAVAGCLVAALQAAWPTPVPVLFWDESFSTRRVVGPRRPVPGSRRDRDAHALAACLILEEVVHALRPLEGGARTDEAAR